MTSYSLILADVLTTTENAALLLIDNEEFWIPRSVIDEGGEVSEFAGVTEFFIKTWFCEKEEFI